MIRVAGNVLGSEVLGSLHYAVENLAKTLRLIVVLGHSGCGAVSTAVDLFLNPRDYLQLATAHSLRSILDRLLVVIQACAKKLVETFGPDVVHRHGYRMALVEAAIVANAALFPHTRYGKNSGRRSIQVEGGVQQLLPGNPRGVDTARRQIEATGCRAPRPNGICRARKCHSEVGADHIYSQSGRIKSYKKIADLKSCGMNSATVSGRHQTDAPEQREARAGIRGAQKGA